MKGSEITTKHRKMRETFVCPISTPFFFPSWLPPPPPLENLGKRPKKTRRRNSFPSPPVFTGKSKRRRRQKREANTQTADEKYEKRGTDGRSEVATGEEGRNEWQTEPPPWVGGTSANAPGPLFVSTSKRGAERPFLRLLLSF